MSHSRLLFVVRWTFDAIFASAIPSTTSPFPLSHSRSLTDSHFIFCYLTFPIPIYNNLKIVSTHGRKKIYVKETHEDARRKKKWKKFFKDPPIAAEHTLFGLVDVHSMIVAVGCASISHMF